MSEIEFKFKERNRFVLIKAASCAVVILLFGVVYHPSTSHNNNKHAPIVQVGNKEIPNKFRNLGSNMKDDDENEKTKRPAACANVDYANTTYLKEVDPYTLSVTELLLHLDHPAYVSPPNPHGPTIVDIGVYIHSIFNLDPGYNTFEMEGYMDLIWCDPHTEFDPHNTGKDKHIYLERDAAKELEDIWWPAVTFVNEKGKREIENQEVIIESDGTVEYREKFKVTLTTPFDMGRFPFDKQVLRAEVESFAWNADQMVFHVEEDLVGFSEDFEIPEQTMTHIEEHLETKMEARDRHPFSELVTEIHVYRNPTYYMTKVCIPLGLIVAISWAVFWMDPADLADRMAISFTGVLTSAAYQFVVSDIIPRHVTNTFLANFVLVTFLMQILISVENVCVRTVHYRGSPMIAKMIDRISRVMVPLFFIVVCNIIASAQLLKDDTLGMEGVIAISIGLPILLLVITVFMVRRFTTRHPECKRKTKIDMEKGQQYPNTKHSDLEDSGRTQDRKDSEEERNVEAGGGCHDAVEHHKSRVVFNADLESAQGLN